MKKAKLISHLAELDTIRRDTYMPKEIVDKVIELEKLMTFYLAKELENPNPDSADTARETVTRFLSNEQPALVIME
jgi:Trk K+ transport system NAD-binding subunit